MELSPYSAAYYDADNNPVELVQSSTVCWSPLNPRDFAGRTLDGEFEHIFRCRNCAGCRKYEDLMLRRRLAQHYDKAGRPVWIVEFASETLSPGEISARVAQRFPREFESGFITVETHRIAKLKLGKRPKRSHFDGRKQHCVRIVEVARIASTRAWRAATRGMRLSRQELGAWANRFYIAGLPKIKQQSFIQELRGGIRKRHPEARAEVRAWRRGLLLYPSEAQQARTVLARLLAQTSARTAQLTLNCKRPTAVSSLLLPFSENRAKPTERRSKIPDSSIWNRDAGSLKSLQVELDKLRELIAKNPRDG